MRKAIIFLAFLSVLSALSAMGRTERDAPAISGTHPENPLVVYFSMPEITAGEDVDTVAGASIVATDTGAMGNTEYVASIIADELDADIFRIETVQEYPIDHDELTDYAQREQRDEARPELKGHIGNIGEYDAVILGYPNWWADMPQPVYTFLDEYDLSGKTIYLFVTHGGSRMSDTRDTVASIEDGSIVSDNALVISRRDVSGSEAEAREWARSL